MSAFAYVGCRTSREEAVVREGAGPRHLAFHPSRPWVYVVNELDSSVTDYRFDVDTGRLTPC